MEVLLVNYCVLLVLAIAILRFSNVCREMLDSVHDKITLEGLLIFNYFIQPKFDAESLYKGKGI